MSSEGNTGNVFDAEFWRKRAEPAGEKRERIVIGGTQPPKEERRYRPLRDPAVIMIGVGAAGLIVTIAGPPVAHAVSSGVRTVGHAAVQAPDFVARSMAKVVGQWYPTGLAMGWDYARGMVTGDLRYCTAENLVGGAASWGVTYFVEKKTGLVRRTLGTFVGFVRKASGLILSR